ncbi:hypothetical protein FRC02_004007 [Tulasnella sp. 418]|nr:hypothetical protein FRC02_004007 [Tulasnella sp. 418]
MGAIKIVYGKSDFVLLAVAASYQNDPAGLFGPWLLGLCFDCFFMGLLCLQVSVYIYPLALAASLSEIIMSGAYVLLTLQEGLPMDENTCWASTSVFISQNPTEFLACMVSKRYAIRRL